MESSDCVRTSVGIRTVRFDKDEGFFLNGEHFSILGANVHQDHAGWADAVTRSGIRRDIQMIKECGMNTIRGSHYPHHPYFAQVCDERYSILVGDVLLGNGRRQTGRILDSKRISSK